MAERGKTLFFKPRMQRILFATDLSESAGRAFNYATALAGAFGATITVLHILEKLTPNAELLVATLLEYPTVETFRAKSQEEVAGRIRKYITRFCSEAADRIPECPLMLEEVIVEPGKAADRILHHVNTGKYDALVMGSRGHGLLRDFLLGGTSRKVLQASAIPVFVVSYSSESGSGDD